MTRVTRYPMPSDVMVEAMGDHARYYLPQRHIGALRWVGLLPVAMGVVMIGVVSRAFGPAVQRLFSRGAFGIYEIAFAGLLLLFLLPILRLMLFGLVVIAGRTEIRLINGKLSARERVGPFTWTRKRKGTSPVQRVSVGYGDGRLRIDGKPTVRFSHIAGLAALGVEAGPDVKHRFLLTIGYPKEMLLAIGQDLADRLHVEFREGLMKRGQWVGDAERVEANS
jgi:hypothetical protein